MIKYYFSELKTLRSGVSSAKFYNWNFKHFNSHICVVLRGEILSGIHYPEWWRTGCSKISDTLSGC